MRRVVDNRGNIVTIGLVPVGAILAWHKTLSNTPALPSEFVECNGGNLSDPGSVYNGQPIPNLNGYGGGGANSFLRGQTASGGSGGTETHTHAVLTTLCTGTTFVVNTGTAHTVLGVDATFTGTADPSSTLPTYFEVVWIMRVK
jgi:hypothetical protein